MKVMVFLFFLFLFFLSLSILRFKVVTLSNFPKLKDLGRERVIEILVQPVFILIVVLSILLMKE